MNEVVIVNQGIEEWYTDVMYCPECNSNFMYLNIGYNATHEEIKEPQYCPGCGRKIKGIKNINGTVFDFKGAK